MAALLAGALAAGGRAATSGSDDQPIDLSSARYRLLFNELEEQHHFSAAELAALFAGLKSDRQVLELMAKPGEAKPYYRYRPLFITPAAIAMGKQSLIEHRPLFDRIEGEFGVDREIIVAIWAVESKFGFNQGSFGVFRTLNTLFDQHPRRSDFFRQELIQFLLLCRANNLDPHSLAGSYAGAFGQAQFMPSSFNRYAIDYDGDQRSDLVASKADVFASIANYLKNFGWLLHAPVIAELGTRLKAGLPEGIEDRHPPVLVDWQLVAGSQQLALPRPPQDAKLSMIVLERGPEEGGGRRYVAGYPNFRAITEYNRSKKYAMVVTELAEAFKR